MQALIVTDKPDWSYWQIAQALVKHNTDPDLHLDVMALKGNVVEFWEREREYDRVLLMGHQMLDLLDARFFRAKIDGERWLTGIHSHHFFDISHETTPEYNADPPQGLIDSLRRFRAVNAVSRRLQTLFSSRGLVIHYTPNGVDTDIFYPSEHPPQTSRFIVGTAYSSKHDWRKGVTSIIRPSCQEAGVDLIEAESRSQKHVAPEDMPEWYRQLSIYCCMSSSEGASIAVLEAAASGVPVVSTRVGGSTELVRHGADGLLIDRSIPALVNALKYLDRNRDQLAMMAKTIRRRAHEGFSWTRVAGAWYDFLQN